MLSSTWKLIGFSVLVCSFLVAAEAPPLHAQRTVSGRQDASLQQLVRNSGYIFQGTVLSMRRTAPKGPHEVASIAVTFQVDKAVLGARTGQKLTIYEWAGLWTSTDRYRVGEQVVLFLYRPSRLGLTSPVGGTLGRLPIDNQGQVVLNAVQSVSLGLVRPGPAPVRGPVRITTGALGRVVKQARTE